MKKKKKWKGKSILGKWNCCNKDAKGGKTPLSMLTDID